MKNLILGLTLLGFLFLGQAWGQDFQIFTNDNPPMQVLSKTYEVLGGAGVDVVRELQARIGDHTPIQGVPWTRGYSEAQSAKAVLLFGTARTPEREKLFQWVGPLFMSRAVLISLKSKHLRPRSMEDLKALGSIGSVFNDARGQLLTKAGLTNIEFTNDGYINVNKLLLGRIVAFTSTNVLYRSQIKEAGADPEAFEPIYVIAETPVDLSFSLATPKAVVVQWNRAYRSMVDDGTLNRLLVPVLGGAP